MPCKVKRSADMPTSSVGKPGSRPHYLALHSLLGLHELE